MIHPSASVDLYREASLAIFQEYNAPISLRLQRFSSTEDACRALAADLGSGACRGLLILVESKGLLENLIPRLGVGDQQGGRHNV